MGALFQQRIQCGGWSDFAETLRTGASAFDRLHGMSVWEWFDANPDEREMFAHVMMGLTFGMRQPLRRFIPLRRSLRFATSAEARELCFRSFSFVIPS